MLPNHVDNTLYLLHRCISQVLAHLTLANEEQHPQWHAPASQQEDFRHCIIFQDMDVYLGLFVSHFEGIDHRKNDLPNPLDSFDQTMNSAHSRQRGGLGGRSSGNAGEPQPNQLGHGLEAIFGHRGSGIIQGSAEHGRCDLFDRHLQKVLEGCVGGKDLVDVVGKLL